MVTRRRIDGFLPQRWKEASLLARRRQELTAENPVLVLQWRNFCGVEYGGLLRYRYFPIGEPPPAMYHVQSDGDVRHE